MTQERRAYERAKLEGRAKLTTGRGNVECEVLDISRGGVAIQGRQLASVGEFVRIRLGLPQGESTTWMDPDAIVVRAQPIPEGSVWGLQFVNLDEGTANLIVQYVANKQAADPAASGLRSVSRNERNQAILDLLQKSRKPEGEAAQASPTPIRRNRGSNPVKRDEPAKPKTDRKLAALFRAAVEQATSPGKK